MLSRLCFALPSAKDAVTCFLKHLSMCDQSLALKLTSPLPALHGQAGRQTVSDLFSCRYLQLHQFTVTMLRLQIVPLLEESHLKPFKSICYLLGIKQVLLVLVFISSEDLLWFI